MQEADVAYTMRHTAARFPSDPEPHLLRIEHGLELLALLEAEPEALPRLAPYIVERMTEDARCLRATLWPEVRP